MIDKLQDWLVKKQWPDQRGIFIGTAGIHEDIKTEAYQRKFRFHGLNWKLGINRIATTRYLKDCYESGYTKDVNFDNEPPLTPAEKIKIKLNQVNIDV